MSKKDIPTLIDSSIESKESEESLERTRAELNNDANEEGAERERQRMKLRNTFNPVSGDQREPA